MVVEDDPTVARTTARVLSACFEVAIASTCREAMTLLDDLNEHRPPRLSAALVDVGLPDGSGLDVAERLVAARWKPVIAILTGTDDPAVAEWAFSRLVPLPIDIALGAMPFEERTIGRASPYLVEPSVSLTTCSAEDLLVHKAFAGRDKDWLDIRGILIRQGNVLDLPLVWRELLPLLELNDDTTTEGRLRALVGALRLS